MQKRIALAAAVAACFLAFSGCGDKATDPKPGPSGSDSLDVWGIYTDTLTKAKFVNGYNLYVWSSTGAFQTPPSEVYKGANTLDFVVGTVGWAGIGFQPMGATDIANGVDISAYAKVHFWVKSTATSLNACFQSLGTSGNAPQLPLTSYGYVADNAWHEITIPLADWTGQDLTKASVYFGIVAAATTGGEHIFLDDLWYAK